MSILKELSLKHGGKYTAQSGMWGLPPRDYWLIFETFDVIPSGYVGRAAQIHNSWAMRGQVEAGVRRDLQCYSLVFITEGGGTFVDESTKREMPVQKGDLLCLFPGRPHAYEPLKGKSWNEINVEFVGPVFDAWVGVGLLDPNEPVRHLVSSGSDAEISQWLERFYDVLFPLASRTVSEPNLADAGRMINLIAAMCATWQSNVMNEEVEWANQARKQLLEAPLEQKPDYVALARTFGLGEQAYRKKFKKLCGVSPFAFRSRQQIEAACHELMSSHKSIKEIGYDLGFGSLFYFSRRFKQVTGMTPGEYRKQACE
ncbi:AraC family transcriptional regulator [Cerasicoccus frondis]|uniref:AraC family transcriptional regulator n=1 Tax=Cerasicoccus frondis TaxID=490090 RepID=UPI002852A9CF|nr:AraC family transcriptional regulator [Cerasicoccus frondis]